MIELYELRQFAAFADCGTLSEAAEILHLSQPALSRSMKKIEEEIGVSLFIRRKNRLELNENGAYVVELAKKVLADADALAGKPRHSTGKTARFPWASVPRLQAGCSHRFSAACIPAKCCKRKLRRKTLCCLVLRTETISSLRSPGCRTEIAILQKSAAGRP